MEKEIETKTWSIKTGGIFDGEVWYNPSDDIAFKQTTELEKGMKYKLKFNFDDNGKFKKFDIMESKKMDISEGDKDIVHFDDMMKQARELYKENMSVETELLLDENHKSIINGGWAYRAKITIIKSDSNNQVFVGHGDADMENTDNPNIQVARFRMAETRAIARALRWLLGECVVKEELKQC